MIYSEWKIGVRFPEISDISILDQVLDPPDILSIGIDDVCSDADLRFVNLTSHLQLVLVLKNTRSFFYIAAYNYIVFSFID